MGKPVTDADLAKLTTKQLQQLMHRVDEAIRSAIRASRPVASAAAAGQQTVIPIDLEKERDAWKARRVLRGN